MTFALLRPRMAAGAHSGKLAAVLAATIALTASATWATPLLVVDASSGAVLMEQEATKPWYPASLTKLVTVYAALKAVKDKRISLDTPLVVSARAAKMPPSKMGFKPGTEVTLDNALKMLMVKSANDLAIVIAEGISGSVENFAGEMNRVAAGLGMHQSHFVNPNGLHNDEHYSSAKDMALVAMALYRDFPEHEDLYGIGALRLGSQIIPTHNGLIGRYPGAEGMKTGFTCPAGFNVVVSATRGGRRLIAVVLGYPSAKSRTLKAASLLDISFAGRSSGPPLASLPDVGGSPPNMRSQVCTANRQEPGEDDYAVPVASNGPSGASDSESSAAFFASDGRSSGATTSSGVSAIAAQMATRPYFEPIPVYLGRAPGYTGPSVGARDARPSPSVGAAVTAAIAARSKEAAKTEKAEKPVKHARARPSAKPRPEAKPKPAATPKPDAPKPEASKGKHAGKGKKKPEKPET